MSLAGLGVVAIWHDLLPEAKGDFYEWHNREHMPERVGIPGFRRGRRYIATAGAPEYFNLYEADSPEVLGGADYLTRLNQPTPWTREVVASFRNVARGICRVLYSDGVGQGGAMLTLRFDVSEAAAAEVTSALLQRLLPPLVARIGIAGVHLCRTDEAISGIETAEKQARSDATQIPRWVVLIEGSADDALVQAAQALRAALTPLGVTDFDQASYRLEHQRCKLPTGVVLMRAIKHALNPKAVMNPGKMIRTRGPVD